MTGSAQPSLALETGEPAARDWRWQPVSAFLTDITAAASEAGRIVVGVDGRQGSGKTTLARTLAEAGQFGHVVHTDDVAWWHGFFTWERLLMDGILTPFLAGEAVDFRPPAWAERGREGSITVPAQTRLLVVEGVGAGRAELRDWMAATVWVQADRHEARRRGLERDGNSPETIAFWDEWAAAELEFLAQERPWELADAVVCGTPTLLIPGDPPAAPSVLRGSLR